MTRVLVLRTRYQRCRHSRILQPRVSADLPLSQSLRRDSEAKSSKVEMSYKCQNTGQLQRQPGVMVAALLRPETWCVLATAHWFRESAGQLHRGRWALRGRR